MKIIERIFTVRVNNKKIQAKLTFADNGKNESTILNIGGINRAHWITGLLYLAKDFGNGRFSDPNLWKNEAGIPLYLAKNGQNVLSFSFDTRPPRYYRLTFQGMADVLGQCIEFFSKEFPGNAISSAIGHSGGAIILSELLVAPAQGSVGSCFSPEKAVFIGMPLGGPAPIINRALEHLKLPSLRKGCVGQVLKLDNENFLENLNERICNFLVTFKGEILMVAGYSIQPFRSILKYYNISALIPILNFFKVPFDLYDTPCDGEIDLLASIGNMQTADGRKISKFPNVTVRMLGDDKKGFHHFSVIDASLGMIKEFLAGEK